MFFKPFKKIWQLKDTKGLHVDIANIEKQLLKDRKECGPCIQNDILLAYVEKAFKGRELKKIKKELAKEGYSFYPGTSYRHCLIWEKGHVVDLTPPHDVLEQKIGQHLPTDAVLRDMMKKSFDILKDHPVNIKRKEQGLNPANCIWFWGAGTKPMLSDFKEKTGKKGIMISAVDLLKGIAVGAGMDNAIVEGANGGLHTNYAGKMQAAADALLRDGYDFAYIHVEAPDEMGHQGSVERKVEAIE